MTIDHWGLVVILLGYTIHCVAQYLINYREPEKSEAIGFNLTQTEEESD